MTSNRKRFFPRVTLIIALVVLVIVIVPAAVAWYLYIVHPVTEQAVGRYGYQIRPAIHFDDLAIKNGWGVTLPHRQWQYKWVLMYIAPGVCNDVCHGVLANMDLVAKGTQARYKVPIDNLVLSFNNLNKQELHHLLGYSYPDFVHAYVNISTFKRVFSQAPFLRKATFQGMLYIIKPNGNIVMSFSTEASDTNISRGLNSLITQKQT